MSTPLKPLALTMGEPAGVGPELTLKAWQLRDKHQIAPFVYLGSGKLLEHTARALELAVEIICIEHVADTAEAFANGVPVIDLELDGALSAGTPSVNTAAAVLRSIQHGVELVQNGDASAIVTNPIQKNILKAAGFDHPGHTEYLAQLANLDPPPVPVMMLVSETLKVVPVTVHIPLDDVAQALSPQRIVMAGKITAETLQRYFGIATPRIAVAGLNPHAGEGGVFGPEDLEIITPAVQALRDGGIEAFGPVAADSLFHEQARATYDAALCMYHDQALIPIKTLAFDEAVNVTLGLPFIRTSPDHGTALDIAGKGVANPASLISALRLAGDMAQIDASEIA